MRLTIPLVIVSGLALLCLGFRNAGPTTTEPPAEMTRPSVQLGHEAQKATGEPLVLPRELPLPEELFTSASARELTLGDRATFHPHGEQLCASGCAVSHHPTQALTKARFHQLLTEYVAESIGEPGEALETLLYFGRQTVAWLERDGVGPLDSVRANVLHQELQRNYAEVAIRLVDEMGEVRALLPPTQMPLDRRHEFELAPHNLQPLIASGTVKRVGRDHLWTRL